MVLQLSRLTKADFLEATFVAETSKRQFPALSRNVCFPQQFGTVVPDVSDVRVGFEHLHFVRFERPEEMEGQPFGFFPVEPSVVVAWMEDDGHAGMDPAYVELLASVVTMAKDWSQWPCLSFQASHRPAKPMGLPLASSKL